MVPTPCEPQSWREGADAAAGYIKSGRCERIAALAIGETVSWHEDVVVAASCKLVQSVQAGGRGNMAVVDMFTH